MSMFLKKIARQPAKWFRFFLWTYFRFDKWHIYPPAGRKYSSDIVRYLRSKSEIQHLTISEIGCGLGDLIRSVKCAQRVGYDLDENALRAARFMAGITLQKNIRFEWFKFPESNLKGYTDIIILVNWIHHVEPQILELNLRNYFTHHLNQNGEIIIDTVQDRAYKINHSIEKLTAQLPCTVTKIGDDINKREIFAIKKT